MAVAPLAPEAVELAWWNAFWLGAMGEFFTGMTLTSRSHSGGLSEHGQLAPRGVVCPGRDRAVGECQFALGYVGDAVAERTKLPGFYSGARTDIINAHADLRAALDMLVKAAGPDDSGTERLADLMSQVADAR